MLKKNTVSILLRRPGPGGPGPGLGRGLQRRMENVFFFSTGFSSHMVRDFDYFLLFLAASAAKNCKKQAVIQSAASPASARGGCASSRLDHGLKFCVIQEGCASEFSDCDWARPSCCRRLQIHLSDPNLIMFKVAASSRRYWSLG